MLDSNELRVRNLRMLIEKHGSLSSLSRALGYNSPSYLAQMVGQNPTRPFSEKNARRFENQLGLPSSWSDSPHDGDAVLSTNVPEISSSDSSHLEQESDHFRLAQGVGDAIRKLSSVLEEENLEVTRPRFAELAALVAQDAIEACGHVHEPRIRSIVRVLKS